MNVEYPEYPEYNEIESFTATNPKFLYEFIEYSYKNHERMKRIYEALNSDDNEDEIRDIVRNIGEEIHNEGGIDALRGCFYMLVIACRVIVTRLSVTQTSMAYAMKDVKTNKLIRHYQDQIHNLESYFDGVGEWRR